MLQIKELSPSSALSLTLSLSMAWLPIAQIHGAYQVCPWTPCPAMPPGATNTPSQVHGIAMSVPSHWPSSVSCNRILIAHPALASSPSIWLPLRAFPESPSSLRTSHSLSLASSLRYSMPEKRRVQTAPIELRGPSLDLYSPFSPLPELSAFLKPASQKNSVSAFPLPILS